MIRKIAIAATALSLAAAGAISAFAGNEHVNGGKARPPATGSVMAEIVKAVGQRAPEVEQAEAKAAAGATATAQNQQPSSDVQGQTGAQDDTGATDEDANEVEASDANDVDDDAQAAAAQPEQDATAGDQKEKSGGEDGGGGGGD